MCFPPADTQMKRLKSLLPSLSSFLLPFSFPSPLARQLWPGAREIRVPSLQARAALQPAG